MNMRLHHVTVPRPPASATAARAFYGTLLGLPELPAEEAAGENVAGEDAAMTNGAEEQLLCFAAGDTEIHLRVEEPPGQDRSARHFCLVVQDLEALRRELAAAGVAVVGAPPHGTQPHYYVRDPFGNLIELAPSSA